MALRFPHALVLGVDMVPSLLDTDTFPPNLTFEVDDVNLRLNHFHGDEAFDLIHMRMAQSGIKDLDALLIDLQHCLKPGGLLIIIDMPPYLWDQFRNVIPMARLPTDDDTDTNALSETGSWLARFLFGMFFKF
jgi:trans-aconitate methyltransferase